MKNLKQPFFWFCCLLAIAVWVPAQVTDTFDIASFSPPAGWAKQAKDGGLLFSTSDHKRGTYAMIVLYKSSESTASPKTDFDAEWKQYVAGTFPVKAGPQMEPAKEADGRTISIGGGIFETELGTSGLILSTFSGFGRRFSVAAIFNSQEYLPVIEAFVQSIVLAKTAAGPAPVANPNADSSIIGTWGQNLGAHMTYGDPVSAGMAGYSKDQYTFNANGTYTFVSKTFRMAYEKIILVQESGSYEVNGGNLTVKPQKSVIQAWSKLNGGDKFGRLLTSQNRKLETVTYRFTRHYFSGIDQWQLVLQADDPTERDGPFSTFTLFFNAWYYKPISANNPAVELPK